MALGTAPLVRVRVRVLVPSIMYASNTPPVNHGLLANVRLRRRTSLRYTTHESSQNRVPLIFTLSKQEYVNV